MFVPNRKHTVEHLREVTDEVNGLHPILHVLFKKLPGIERVHYNQGPNELGADFILYRRDMALRRSTCIGVVVKADSIRQNTTEVERQIKECFIPRKSADGTEIQIREVWVVSSQEISRNAKDVLNKLYSDRKIEFIAAQDLAGMIDEFAPDSFVTTSPLLQQFAEHAIAEIDADDRRSLIVPGMDSFYIEPSILRREFDGYGNSRVGKKISSMDELLKSILSSQLSVIQAGAGGGKSRLARELSKRIIASSDFSDGKLLSRIDHATNYLEDPYERMNSAMSELHRQVGSQPKVVLFVDGFDEVDIEDKRRSAFVEELVASACKTGICVVLLSRPFDETTVLGARIHSLDVFRIEPLKGQKAIEFLSKITGQLDAKSRLVTDLNKSILFRALEGAPIAYMLLGRLIAENQQDLPSNLTELFQKYTELTLGRWEMSKGLRSQQEFEVIVESLIWISKYLLDNQITELARSEIEQWISEYCRVRGLGLAAPGLVDRMCERNSVLYLRADVGTVGFRHRAFCEFFYAKHLDRSPAVNLSGEVFTPYWVNSYYFLAGIKRDCPDLLRSLLNLEAEHESEQLYRAVNFGNLLLAGYMTPTEVSREALKKISKDLALMYVDACNPTSNSVLTQLPTIQLLCLISSAFWQQYGYKYFKQALEEAIFDVEAGELTEENAISIFLLSAAYKEAGGALRFDDLIERFGDSLPVALKLAIQHESDRMKVVTDRVKRMERNLRRAFQANKGSKDYLHKLYKVPVRQLDKKLV